VCRRAGDVVEAVAGLVGRQERIDVHVERQEITNRVVIFGAVEAAEGLRAAGIGLSRIERFLEDGNDVAVSGFVRARESGGRHGAGS
jgi:hypothetical protein